MGNSFKDKAEKRRASANNPAMMFISQAEEQTAEQAEEPKRNRNKVSDRATRATPEHETPLRDTPLQAAKRAPQGREAKTRRLQLLLTPSLYEAVKERAEAEGISVNETISELLQTALRT